MEKLILIFITIYLCQKNITMSKHYIIIYSSNIVVLSLFCYLMDLFFTSSQSIIIYTLNMSCFGGRMGREIFFFNLKSKGSLCPGGAGDQWVGTVGKPTGVEGSRQLPGLGSWGVEFLCAWAVKWEMRTFGATLVATYHDWVSKSFRNQQCGARLPSLNRTTEDSRVPWVYRKQKAKPGGIHFTH